jgi:hypothetical protein
MKYIDPTGNEIVSYSENQLWRQNIGKPTYELMQEYYGITGQRFSDNPDFLDFALTLSYNIWNDFGYAHYRTKDRDYGLINLWEIPYLTSTDSAGKKTPPELANILNEGQAVCFEFAIFIAHALKEHPISKDFDIKYATVRIEEDNEKPSYHSIVILTDKNGNRFVLDQNSLSSWSAYFSEKIQKHKTELIEVEEVKPLKKVPEEDQSEE